MGETLGGQRQHHLIHPTQPAFAFRDDHRLEGPCPVPGHVQRDRTDLSDHRLRPGPVTAVATVMAGRVIRRIPHMLSELSFQTGLEDPFRQLGQQPARTDELDPLRTCPFQQLDRQQLRRHPGDIDLAHHNSSQPEG